MLDQLQVETPAKSNHGGLRLYLLGPTKISRDSLPITIARKQVRLLLYYLATCDQMVSYEHLRFLFWPDTTDTVSQRHLTRLLNHISDCLGEPDILRTNETHVQLDRRRYWSDVRAFRALCAQKDASIAYENQLQAVELYRGPFLEGVPLNTYKEFETIIENLRTGLEQNYLLALEFVITKQAAAEDFEGAIELCQRYLQTDDLNENIHRTLIQLYARLGNRKLALRQFRTCKKILHENLGIKPMLETQGLYQAVLDGSFERLLNYSASPVPVLMPAASLPFLGRGEILERFNDAVAHASMGKGTVFLINGDSGKGKTRLLQEFEHQVREGNLTLLVGCHPGTQSIPYYTVLKILRYIQNLDPDLVPLDQALLLKVRNVLQELNDQVAQVPRDGEEPGKFISIELWDSLTNIFLQLAGISRPLILMIDDLHLADSSTLEWLSYFSSQIEGKACLLVGTYCCQEEGSLAKYRGQLLIMGEAFQEIQLDGLVSQAVYQAVKITFGNVTGCRSLAARLGEITAGNPLYLQEILRGIVQSGYLPGELIEKDQWPLPENVWKAVEIRLGRLKPLPRKIIEIAAYLELVFNFDQVACLLDIPEMELLDAFDDLTCRNFLVECDPGYQFQHPLIRLAMRRTTRKNRQAVIERRLQRLKEQSSAS